jgi:hypothetical protein
MKTIAIKRADGGVGIMSVKAEHVSEAIRKYSELHSGTDFAYVSHREVQPSEIPTDRTFRDAWIDDGVLKHDTAKVKKIHKKRIEDEIEKEMIKQDKKASKADDDNDAVAKKAAKDERKRLRALSALLDAAMTNASTIEAVIAFDINYGVVK